MSELPPDVMTPTVEDVVAGSANKPLPVKFNPVIVPLALMLPTTSSFSAGVVLLMPTLPVAKSMSR